MRAMSTYAQSVIGGNYIALGFFVQMQFASSTEYIWTGVGSITWNSQTWTGVGDLGKISTVTEDSNLTSQGITLSLAGVRSSLLTEAMSEIKQGLPCKVWIVLMSAEGVPVDSIGVYSGLMDQSDIEEGVDSSVITIAVESRLSDLQRAQNHRLTDADQRAKYPTDDAFKWTQQLLDWNGAFGAK
jgi:hypothetical protein